MEDGTTHSITRVTENGTKNCTNFSMSAVIYTPKAICSWKGLSVSFASFIGITL